ncbi:MAG TPA: 50S ribosomal protein L22 [Candidatus Solibacter sp.]|jgi:large subunit ribosomal protein L22|nr:50S ribosomal protein L22 [Candidatus Solibacter sp.]
MEVEAKARYMRIPPRKARLVAATVVGMPVKDALVVLGFTPKAAAQEIGKVVKSAAANATNNFSQDEDALVVKRIVVNEGPTLKRGRARARGMYFSIFKRTCHITAVVEALEQAPRRPARARAAAAAPAQPKAAPKPKADSKTPETTEAEAKAGEVTEVAEEQVAEEAEAEATTVTPEAVEETPAVADAPAEAAVDAAADEPAEADAPKPETNAAAADESAATEGPETQNEEKP